MDALDVGKVIVEAEAVPREEVDGGPGVCFVSGRIEVGWKRNSSFGNGDWDVASRFRRGGAGSSEGGGGAVDGQSDGGGISYESMPKASSYIHTKVLRR